jgi:hypothetical protein
MDDGPAGRGETVERLYVVETDVREKCAFRRELRTWHGIAKRLNPASHLARQQCRLGIVVLGDCAINHPMVTGLKHQTDALFRQPTERSVDGSVKLIKHFRHIHAVKDWLCVPKTLSELLT